MPFGQVRTSASPITQTDFAYTGQRNLDAQGNSSSIGLMDYNARFYDDYLNRWSQPDTIIHDGNPQSLNRLSYVENNPINFNDPSGHCVGPDGVDLPDGSAACNLGGGAPTAPTTPTDLCQIDPGLPMCTPLESSSFILNLPKRVVIPGYMPGGDDSNIYYNPFTLSNYLQGWERSDTAFSIAVNPDATWEEKIISGGYMVGWVGANVIAGGGLAVMGCAATGVAACVTAGGIATTGAEIYGSNPNAGITVLGYSEDLEQFVGNPNVNILQNVHPYGWESVNIPFLDQAMARGDIIVLYSNYLEQPGRIYPQEFLQVMYSFYQNTVDISQH